jgi:hypothetical protein
MSYAGTQTITEFWGRAEFIHVTAAGKAESDMYDVDML